MKRIKFKVKSVNIDLDLDQIAIRLVTTVKHLRKMKQKMRKEFDLNEMVINILWLIG